MTCFLCKGTVQDGFSTFSVDLDNCVVVVKKVPARICCQCGEVSYSDEVGRRLEQIVNSIREGFAAEIAVVNYSEKAA